MNTELILYHEPFRANILDNISYDYDSLTSLATMDGVEYSYQMKGNTNQSVNRNFLQTTRANTNGLSGLNVDLDKDIAIPITYTILDIREPEQRKTNWSKTITLPGSKNNNRIFSHIYEIGQDGWVTIGNNSVYQGFNPNLKKDMIIKSDGIQIMRGSLQLKKVKRNANGDIEYEVALSGDLTSLFYDVGKSKLADLEWSEWDHIWSRENIVKSWGGISKKNGVDTEVISDEYTRNINRIYLTTSGRLGVELSLPTNSFQIEDWIRIDLNGTNTSDVDVKRLRALIGSSTWDLNDNDTEIGYGNEYQIIEVIDAYNIVLNWFYPIGLPNSVSLSGTNTIKRRISSGNGYVYPLISWGDEEIGSSWGVSSMVPGFYVKEIWDKIMKSTNSRYNSEFLDSQIFKRLVLIQKRKDYEIDTLELNSRKFRVGIRDYYITGTSYKSTGQYRHINTDFENTIPTSTKTSPDTYKYTPDYWSTIPFKVDPDNIVFFDNGLDGGINNNNWSTNGRKWIVRKPGEYDLTTNVKIEAYLKMNGYVGQFPAQYLFNGTASFTPNTPGYQYTTAPTSGGGRRSLALNVYVNIVRLRGGQQTTIETKLVTFKPNQSSWWSPTGPNPNWNGFGTYQPESWRGYDATVNVEGHFFNTGDEVWVEVVYEQSGVTIPPSKSGSDRYVLSGFREAYQAPGSRTITYKEIVGEFFIKIDKNSYIYNKPSEISTENSIIEARSFLPKDMTCQDFLLSIIKSFNLHIEQDPDNDRLYNIEPRDDYYKRGNNLDDFVDWTEKMDADSVEFVPMGELVAKYYTFENKKETDYWNKKFLDERGRDYMSYTKEINNDFLKNEVKISSKFGSTVMVNNPDKSDVVMPAVYSRENGIDNKPMSNSSARMLIWGGLKPYTADRGGKIGKWYMKSDGSLGDSKTHYNRYPYAGTVDSPVDPIHDINWYNMEVGDFVYWDSARWSNGNLFNRYWKNMMLEISDPASKVITVDLNLTPMDIYKLDFKKIYILDGQWLRLQKIIDYDPVNVGMTTCEFLKVKLPTRYKMKSTIIGVNGKFDLDEVLYDNSNGKIVTPVYESAPVKKRPNIGYNNYSSDSELSTNTTVVINGSSNRVGPNSVNISVSGIENTIGSNSDNITISGGNGNRIAGGVFNVNMIGTDKKVVNESDVTYINGVRYKYGMPISKASVIDGGIDEVSIKHSNSTTANVIDGCEDIVINGGSSTYENVINAGIDDILPDVEALGISTSVNANPSTNYTGGYETTGVIIDDMVNIVRENARLADNIRG